MPAGEHASDDDAGSDDDSVAEDEEALLASMLARQRMSKSAAEDPSVDMEPSEEEPSDNEGDEDEEDDEDDEDALLARMMGSHKSKAAARAAGASHTRRMASGWAHTSSRLCAGGRQPEGPSGGAVATCGRSLLQVVLSAACRDLVPALTQLSARCGLPLAESDEEGEEEDDDDEEEEEGEEDGGNEDAQLSDRHNKTATARTTGTLLWYHVYWDCIARRARWTRALVQAPPHGIRSPGRP